MKLPNHKTKIVCTIGPSSRSTAVLREMIRAGMNVARINFSHGTQDDHERDIENIRHAAAAIGRRVAILADLPGPKIRVGKLSSEPLELKKGERVTLTTRNVIGSGSVIPVSFDQLAASVSTGSVIYLSDGFIQLRVEHVDADEVECRVIIGGSLLSHKGLNLPTARISGSAISDRDMEFVLFGLDRDVDTFGVSFVQDASDIVKIKELARQKGKNVYAVAKIERARAVANIDAIAAAADAIMVARGDLGVELPLEDIASVQKQLIFKANLLGRPVITATQMLESMIDNTRPTRAEVTDVANAILDGSDAIMLSEETAIGRYPVQAVQMMTRIAVSIEAERKRLPLRPVDACRDAEQRDGSIADIVSTGAVRVASDLKVRFIVTPTHSGKTPRHISRLKPDCWVLAFTPYPGVCENLMFSYGVHPFQAEPTKDGSWYETIMGLLRTSRLVKRGDVLLLTQAQFSPGHRTVDSLAAVRIR